ncbi:MAG: ATP-dependent Clp protease proteolytic subunit [Hyphomicrobiaceae bacterium]|nr:ATP-dependent Clp protease proteolytic subunit [Hyphomicrobiaceae bacterium]
MARTKAKPLYISFIAEVNQITVPALLGAIGQHMAQFDELHLMLSTPGGNVREGIAAYNALMAMPLKVFTYNIGQVNSIGNVLYLAGQRRFANKTSSFMFHGVGFDITGQRFEEKQLIERLDGLRNDQQLISDVMRKRAKISAKRAHELFLQAAFVLPDEARSLGIVDEIRDINVPKGATFMQLVFQR